MSSHGMPRKFLRDRGSNFLRKLLQSAYTILNIKKINTSSDHPQTDGFVERINGVIAQTLSMYVASNHKDWDVHLPAAIFASNTSVSAANGDTPFFLMHGREPLYQADV